MNTTLRRRTTTTVVAAVALAAALGATPNPAAAVTPGTPVTVIAAPGPPGISDLVTTADGTEFVGLATSNGTFGIARVARHAPGGDWETPVELSHATAPASAPALAVRSDGGVAAVWAEFPGGNPSVWYAERAADGTWSTPLQLTADGRDPRLAVAADGTALAVWRTQSTYRVMSAVRPPEGEWSAPTTLSAADGSAAGDPDVAFDGDGDGNAVAIWHKISGTGPGVYKVQSARRPSGGAWSGLLDVSVPQAETATEATLVVDAAGVATAAWVQYTVVDEQHHRGRVQSARLVPSAAAWSSPVDLSDAEVDTRTVSLDLAADGVVTAAWPQVADGSTTIRAARRTTEGWSAAVTVGAAEQPITGRSEGVALDVAPDGRAAAAWIRSTADGPWVVEVATAAADGAWTASRPATTEGIASRPYVAVADGGDVDAIWGHLQSGYSVAAAFLDRSEPVVHEITIPSTGDVDEELGFSVSADDRWGEIADVSWDFGDGAIGSGAEVTHVYADAGSHPVTVTVTDEAGNTTVRSGMVEVAAAPEPTTPTPTTPTPTPTVTVPQIESVHLTHRTIRAAGARAKAPRATRLKLRLSGPATVRVTVAGKRRGLPTATLTRKLKAGSSAVSLSARIGKRTLRPGRYVVSVVATNAAGVSKPARVVLRVVRPARR